jgi:WD40 repeat protein
MLDSILRTGLYDLAWSEVHQNQIVTGSGDGSLKLWDITLNVRLHLLLRFSLQLTRLKLGFSNPGVAGTHEGSV